MWRGRHVSAANDHTGPVTEKGAQSGAMGSKEFLKCNGEAFPLLTSLLKQKGLRLKGLWTSADVGVVFDVAKRTVQDWSKSGKLKSRDLPGRARFLSEDLEEFLRASIRKSGGKEDAS